MDLMRFWLCLPPVLLTCCSRVLFFTLRHLQPPCMQSFGTWVRFPLFEAVHWLLVWLSKRVHRSLAFREALRVQFQLADGDPSDRSAAMPGSL